MPHRMSATVLAVASTLSFAAPAHADADETLVMLISADYQTTAWEAESDSGSPVYLRPFMWGAPQHWYWDATAGTFRNQASDQCLTATGSAVVQTPCDRGADQKWVWYPLGDPGSDPALFANAATGTCVTHQDVEDPLVLEPCDADRLDQSWTPYPE